MDNTEQRFDALLHAMTTKPPLEKTSKEAPASNAGSGEGSGDTRTPKGKPATTLAKR